MTAPSTEQPGAAPVALRTGGSRGLVLGSGFGMVPTAGASADAASKAAVARLVDTVGAELAGTGVTVLAVSPGMVRTDMTRGFPPGFLEHRSDLVDPVEQAGTPVESFPALLRRVAAGEADALSGRFLRSRDDPDGALDAAATSSGASTLRLVRYTD